MSAPQPPKGGAKAIYVNYFQLNFIPKLSILIFLTPRHLSQFIGRGWGYIHISPKFPLLQAKE